MSHKERRHKEREDMKQMIADAAVDLIIKDGYENMSIRKIANIIEYSPTTIYNYYPDKAAIISYMVEGVQNKIVAECKRIITENSSLSADKVLRLCINAYLQCIVKEPQMGKAILLSGAVLFTEEGNDEDMIDSGKALMSSLLQKGEAQGVFRKLDENITLIILTSLLGFALSSIENQLYALDEYDHLVSVFSDMILRGILNNDFFNGRVECL